MGCSSIDVSPRYIVTTTVPIKEGKIPEVLALFKKTNPNLVKNQKDWVRAIFSSNEKTGVVMVQAYWVNAQSYMEFSNSSEFRQTMQQFGQYFAGKPEVTINEILFEM